MKLTFWGAARAVTGSCHCVECNGKKYLLDCGLQQGRDEKDNAVLDFHPGTVDAVIVSHAHIDHSGRLPLLVKRGFHGPIYCTGMTAKLLGIMLLDSAHIQESDAAYANQKGKRAGKERVEPLYTIADAQETLELLVPCGYGERVRIDDGAELEFTDAGHLLGSAQIGLWLTEAGETRKLVFTGDLGNVDQPIIRDPQPMEGAADYIITESTYGDRLHDKGQGSYKEVLAALIDETMAKGGNVIIPSFAVGRTQELLYFIREIKEEGLVKSRPDFQVVVDSPLAKEATEIFSGDLTGYLDEKATAAAADLGALFRFPGLVLTQTLDESKALNGAPTPRVIISASGMCEAGRVRHHLKHNLWRSECAVVFVGYQAEGSLGRRLLEGASVVKLFGDEIAVRAKVARVEGLSSHADQAGLLNWMESFTPGPRQIFVVHGDKDVTAAYAGLLKERGFAAHAPDYGEVYDLLSDRMLAAGIPPAVKEQAEGGDRYPASAAYKRLEEVGEQLMLVIRHNKGGANKDLGKFADQIRALIQKWDR